MLNLLTARRLRILKKNIDHNRPLQKTSRKEIIHYHNNEKTVFNPFPFSRHGFGHGSRGTGTEMAVESAEIHRIGHLIRQG